MGYLKKVGKRYYLINEQGRSEGPIGPDRSLAIEVLNQWEQRRTRRRFGLVAPEAVCDWTLAQLRDMELSDARGRGLDIPTREKSWRAILKSFGERELIGNINVTSLRRLATEAPSNQTYNRRRALLKWALEWAESDESSGYRVPAGLFKRHRRLTEKGKRKGRALSLAQSRFLVARMPLPRLQLLLLTASRLGEVPTTGNGLAVFQPHKRGVGRRFRIEDRLEEILRFDLSWSRHFWDVAVLAFEKEFGFHVRAHDLRHTALTVAGGKPGASVVSVMKLAGWRDPSMAATYLHPENPIEDFQELTPLDPL